MDVDRLEEALDAFVPEILEMTGAPGQSAAVGVGDQVVLAKGYGVADLDSARPMDAHTVGPTGSDAKPYTALAAMQLVESGHLALDVPVNDWLDFAVCNPHGDRHITLRDLLTHRSGLGTTFGFCDLRPPPPLGDHLRRVLDAGVTDVYGGALFPLWGTPVGAHYQYSNTGIALVGYLVERVNPEGVTFSEWVKRHIFEPLGMTSSWFPPAQNADHLPADVVARRSTGYATLPGLRITLPQIYVADYPAGTALTTPSEHCRFLLSMAHGGRLGSVRILEQTLAEAMVSPQAGRGPDPSTAVGLVWNLFNHGTEDFYFGHGGEYMWGWNNVSRVWPGEGVAVTANTNQWDLGDNGTSDRPSHLAGLLLMGVVGAWVRGIDPRPRRRGQGALAYLAGMLVADRLGPRLGMPSRLDPLQVEDLVGAAHPAADYGWDVDAFRDALMDHRLARSPADIFSVVRSQLPDHQREILQRRLGVPGLGRLASLFGG